MDVDLNKISFLRRDHPFNFAKVDEVYEEIIQRNHVYDNASAGEALLKKVDTVTTATLSIDASTSSDVQSCASGVAGDEILHAGSLTTSSRAQFNFVCTVPYTSEQEFNQSIQKILTMQRGQGQLQGAGQGTRHLAVAVAGPVAPPPERSREGPVEEEEEEEEEEEGTSTVRSAVDRTTSHTDTDTDTDTHRNAVLPPQPPPFSSSSSAEDPLLPFSRRVTKAQIPSAVRRALASSITQQRQREGGESLESEQQRRLSEFTLWRRDLMRTRAHPHPYRPSSP
jgi:hypothetical protein